MLILLCNIQLNMALAGDGPWKCVYCNIANRDNYCTSCGRAKADAITDMRWTCLKCQTINEENAKYCKECGAKKGSRSMEVGEYVTFGTYPQTAAGNDSTPIEWLVLEVDEKGNKVLLLSRYGLDAQPYNTSDTDVTWETCTLRKWLNSTFMNKAFTETEQGAIYTTNVDNSKGQRYSRHHTAGGNNTKDKIFLLSYAEANKYLSVTRENDNNTKSRVVPTAYAIKQGVITYSNYKTADGKAAGRWWLRSPGFNQNYAALVLYDGSYDSSFVYLTSVAVRPALWVNLESGIF